MELTQERLKELFKYDPNTGLFVRIKKTSPSTNVGDIAGYVGHHGYILMRIDNVMHYAHRLAFLYMNGSLPEKHVDHINGVEGDNRFSNLRECSHSENMQNKRKYSNGKTSQINGVSKESNGIYWGAQIWKDGMHLSKRFLTEIDAANWRKEMKKKIHTFNPVDR